MEVRIGTRKSQLALWQTRQVEAILEANGINAHLIEIQSEGDKNQDAPLYQMGTVGVFTRALDEALLSGKIDLAVHSAKDIPSQLIPELEIVAFQKREDPREVVVAMNPEVQLENFSKTWVIGTSSLRRKAQIQHYAKHIQLKDIRGNLNTRLNKVKRGEYDGIMLAYAGVKRMGWENWITQKLNVQVFVPAVGQGSVAIMAKKSFPHTNRIKSLLNHTPTELAIRCERSFLRTLKGGCHTPVFGLATLTQDTLSLTAGIASEDGQHMIKLIRDGLAVEGTRIGRSLAEEVIDTIKHNPIYIHEQ